MATDWKAELRSERAAKDEYFGSNPHSPIPAPEREGFDGLSYYPPEESLRYELELHEYDDPDEVVVGTSTGGEQRYLEWGEFRFAVDGEDVTLQAYKSDPDQDRLWVPFRDETSGEATYGAGRYLDLEPDEHLLESGRWVLDFNEAYNPTCAYSDHYECPLPPTENWLEVPIEAGEQSYH
ncbi:hypothetical protein L593_12400 [Salinarchaeum sp. Harcht-Bsk1]|uniref:DUF1684 domain-containing protein n=1 Tax=Salinarchaeum sp. Harcht-Bsk1 TaxID=1333523 RepID=UPI0003422D19|nr:DUF1684 domain-containing protein [Salinarchaeum sp. Harcht-Bsk1]AGN02419.1 hypothetical protein L593_12400 [Salinarchaeum sp. Harcht-Bsk1]